MTLTEFLLARIAEDEAAARAAFSSDGAWYTERVEDRLEWWVSGEFGGIASTGYVGNSDSQPIAEHMARHDPARVLAECEAKRKIVEKYLNWCEPEKIGPNAGLGKPRGDEWARATRFETEMILIIVANIYAAHPDFRPEWRL